MRRYVSWVAVASAVFVQLSWAPHWGSAGGRPDVVTLVAVCLAFLGGPMSGALAGFGGGLALDLMGTGVVGVGALARTLAGFAAGLVERTVFGRSILVPMVAAAAATALSQVIELAVLLLLDRSLPIMVSMGTIVVPAAMYNGLLAGVAYPLLAAVSRRERGPAPIEPLS